MRSWLLALTIFGCTVSAGLAQNLTPQSDTKALVDLRIGKGDKNITQAWFIAPTKRYPHFVQGSKYEPGGVRVKLRGGNVLTLMLDDTHVFEDRQPRLADLDGDGEDELVVVLTALDKGASLAAFSVVDGALKLKAQTPYIGRPYRWLNPAGIADFDGDGKLDVALVAMPHLVKRLDVWSLVGGKFKRWGAFEGYSNHRNGSVHTGMSAVSDFDGDGIADLALPGADRRSIEFVSLKNRSLNVLNSAPLPAPVDGPFVLKANGVSVGLANGKSVRVSP